MTRLRDVLAVENGAHFINADLHVHSYGGSADVKDPGMTPGAIVESALRQGLSLVAITDHNSAANVEEAVAAGREHAGEILVIPGVEVSTAHGHLLSYFSPDRIGDLYKYIQRLDLIGDPGAQSTHTPKSMADAIAEAHRLGGICIAAHIDRERTGFEVFAPGFQNWKRDVITQIGLYGVECDNAAHLDWYTGNEPGGAGAAERNKLISARQSVSELKARWQLAHFQGSDAHSLAQFETASQEKSWTRIKLAELTFEAFRVAAIDALARVRAVAALPRAVPRVRGMSFVGGFLNGETIHFSDNLNCFVGGRGTGKSTAVRALAFAFGRMDDFASYDNCPEAVHVFCEDTNGVQYRYLRTRSGTLDVKAKDDEAANVDVPEDSFRIEYFGQGELAEVAKDPLNTPQLFQEFLDRHIEIGDLRSAADVVVTRLRENAARMAPLEVLFAQLPDKKKGLEGVNSKLKVAEEGNLRGVVGHQSQIASEKVVRSTVEKIAQEYARGASLTAFTRDYAAILKTAGECTNDPDSVKHREAIRKALADHNLAIKTHETELTATLKATAAYLNSAVAGLKASHQALDAVAAGKLAELKARGLTASNIAELEVLIRQKTALAKDIGAVEQRKAELEEARAERKALLAELDDYRKTLLARRKAQLGAINRHLSATIRDYTVFVKYDDAGITDEYSAFLRDRLHGTYIHDTVIAEICTAISPLDLASHVIAGDISALAASCSIPVERARKLQERLCGWDTVLELQVLDRPPKPVISVLTKTVPSRPIPVFNLSDGQRHTILLTIAMLAESNVPLVIDQPEDDLDNAFISSTIVATLRAVKERRQVILVTHNANIAVLGDSELILAMQRDGDQGMVHDRGSIDKESTKMAVQNILEGGPAAFARRREIYGY